MEKFVIERISYEAMGSGSLTAPMFTAACRRCPSQLSNSRNGFGNQLRLYDSEVEVGTASRRSTTAAFGGTGRSAEQPVCRSHLKSPCEFCVQSVSANASAQQLSASVTLRGGARPGVIGDSTMSEHTAVTVGSARRLGAFAACSSSARRHSSCPLCSRHGA